MNVNICGLILSFAFVGFGLALATFLRRRGALSSEGSRKLVHILSSNQIVIAALTFTDYRLALIPPAAFIVINAISAKAHIFKAIERENDNSLGTVYYAISVFICTAFSFYLNKPYIAVCGILAMGYGDGLAALIGRRFGKTLFRTPSNSGKTLLGSLTVYASTFVITLVTFCAFGGGFAIGAALTLGTVAVIAELVDAGGLDNITVPVFVSVCAYFYTAQTAPIYIVIGVTLTVCLFAYGIRKLTLPGALYAAVIAPLIYIFAGLSVFFALIAFFIAALICGRLTSNARKTEAESLHEINADRRAIQVLANGLPALIFSALFFATNNEIWLAAAIASICACASDTFAGEIGMAYGKTPRSIFSLRRVRAGLSGGVSVTGLFGGLIGALIIAAFAPSLRVCVIVAICGVFGCLIDSALGQTIQAKYRSADGIGLSEKKNGKPVKGVPYIDNNAVNLISSIIGGVAAAGLCLLFSAA